MSLVYSTFTWIGPVGIGPLSSANVQIRLSACLYIYVYVLYTTLSPTTSVFVSCCMHMVCSFEININLN